MTLRPPRRLGACLALLGGLYAGEARAQERPRGVVEAAILYGAPTLHGVRTGLVLDRALGLDPMDDPVPALVLPLLLGGAGFAAAWWADHPRPLAAGRAFTMGGGMIVGTLGAVGFHLLRHRQHPSAGSPLAAPVAWLGTSLGLGAGLVLAATLRPDPGSATMVTTVAVAGAVGGVFLCGAVGCGEDAGVWLLTGEALGLALGFAATAWLRPSEALVRWGDLAGIAGMVPGLVALAFGPSRARRLEGGWSEVYALSLGAMVTLGIGAMALSGALLTAPRRPLAGATPWVQPLPGGGMLATVAWSG
ncbi:MAG: hypothetical protein HY909_12825 [Deltaproteobacteria bacterium]|nr:hypothetical protein [Deltaproteobacteria bacterium]